MRRRLIAGFALVFALTVTGCGSNANSPSDTNVAGTWSGTVNSTYAGLSTFRATFGQSGNAISGSWSTSSNGGQFSGSKNGASVSVTATPANPLTCPFTANMTLSSASVMSGTYAAFNCSVSDSGTITITKQ